MSSAQLISTLASSGCEVAFDNITRQLYATDASIYQVEPVAVAFPRGVKQICSLFKAADEAGIGIIPRGAGTGLSGGAIGEGLIVDFARHNRQILALDLERRTVRVEAGVVLDQLNHFLRGYNLRFGPDVATASRATIGGMIANNSSGSHAPFYGVTADHVDGMDVVLSSGKYAKISESHDTMPQQRDLLEDIVQLNSLLIEERFPRGLTKRWPGYPLDRCVRNPNKVLQVLCGSEGTLAHIVSAELKLVPVPDEKGLVLLFFNSITEAMQASVELLRLAPVAIEHLDRVLLDETRGQLEFQAARDLLELDRVPCESILAVEFFDHVSDKIASVRARHPNVRIKAIQTQVGADLFWGLRRAGLSLLTGRKGAAKPVAGIEDAAVLPQHLPGYVSSLQKILSDIGVTASFYGHAASGLLHVRPVLNLRDRDDLRKFRHIANEVAALVKHFKGSLAAEHGVGIARTEFMAGQVGDDILNLMREIKQSFDPHNLMNPGKIIPDDRYEFDGDLRARPGHEVQLPFTPLLAFAARDESIIANLEQCNGCGGCLKEKPTMCPTYIASGDESLSTRGRANLIRAALELRGLANGDPLVSAELETALSSCLACKACTHECPSNVNMGLIKAELQYARIRRRGLSLQERLFSSIDLLGKAGCRIPLVANQFLDSSIMRFLGDRILGITSERKLPHYTRQRFDHWFWKRARPVPTRGRVILWDDTFVRYHEPGIGMAAVKVLETAGFSVDLVSGRKCCGRPAFSVGNLDEAMRLGAHNLALLAGDADAAPILFLEPSCYSMFVEEYRELKLPGAEAIGQRCYIFQEFIEALLTQEPSALPFNHNAERVVIHVHCHLKSRLHSGYLQRLIEHLPHRTINVLDTGCCGMAGSFGALKSKYELSLKIAEPLIKEIKGQPFGTIFVTSGASCRHQVLHLTPIKSKHMAELLADALE
ncbi:MAG TPA: FAD-linked oxidase C-terminal domain-containing protein [Verrucomicrobiae bacterium]|nr:FAD-linked oxidase C-terminal domain-containing protein [Verrucomicrobiae bacterium]